MVQSLQSTGERQVGKTLKDIRPDHLARYNWVTQQIDPTDSIFDAGCGSGYGSGILATRARAVLAIDSDYQAIEFARETWSNDNIRFAIGNLHFLDLPQDTVFDCVVAFEVVEHLLNPALFLAQIWSHMQEGASLYISSPNQNNIAHTVELNPYHIRHYTVTELAKIVSESGFRIVGTFQQEKEEIFEGDNSRTLILHCERLEEQPAPSSREAGSDLRATLAEAEHELILRSNAIRRLQSNIHSSGSFSNTDLMTLNAKLQAIRMSISKRDDELSRLQMSETLAVAALLHVERDAAKNLAARTDAEDRLRQSEQARDLLRQRLNEANVILAEQTSEIARGQASFAKLDAEIRRIAPFEKELNRLKPVEQEIKRLKSVEQEIKRLKSVEQEIKSLKSLKPEINRLKSVEVRYSKLLADRRQRLKDFDPSRPTVMGVFRVLVRYKFFIGVLVKAPFYSFTNIQKTVAARRRQLR